MKNNMFNKDYYTNRKQKIEVKRQKILQALVNSAFEFSSSIAELNDELNDLNLREKESDMKTKDKAKKDVMEEADDVIKKTNKK